MVTARDIQINIRNKVFGAEEVRSLEAALRRLKNEQLDMNKIQRRVAAQAGIETETLRRSNAMLQARTQLSNQSIRALAMQRNTEENLRFQIDQRMQTEQDAIRFQEMFAREGIMLSNEQARVVAQNNAMIVAAEQEAEMAIRAKRRAMMQASISLFVLNISVNQLVGALKPLVKGNEAATNAVNDMAAVLNIAIAPMQAFMSIQQLMINLNISLAQSFKMVGSALLAAFVLMQAVRAESAAMRAVFSILTGVIATYAVVQFTSAMMTFLNASAQATLQAVMGNPLGLVALAAGISAGVFALATFAGDRPSAQTRAGQRKRVSRSGLAEIHEGEEIVREPMGEGGVGRRGDITIVLPESYRGTISQSRFLAKEVQRLVNSGQGSIKVKRVVVS